MEQFSRTEISDNQLRSRPIVVRVMMLDSIIILSDQLYMYITFLAFLTVFFVKTCHIINLTEKYIRFFYFFSRL